MQLFSVFHCSKWPHWREVALNAATLIRSCSCCSCSLLRCLAYVSLHHQHVFYSLLIHFHASLYWLLHTNLLPSSLAPLLPDYFPCCSPQRMKCLFHLPHACERRQYAVFLRKNTVFKCCLRGLPTSLHRLGFLCSCWWVLTLSGFIDFCSHMWHYHAPKCNCFWI